jgi:glycosyltransferase involved in cell wall biosynthesis
VTLRVTLVTPGFRPSPGGVEAHTSALADELVRRGVDVEVLTARRGLTERTVERDSGYPVVIYPAWPIASLSLSPRLLLAAVARRRSGRLMHVHSYHASTAVAVLGRRAPTVFTPHYHGRQGHSPLANLLHVGFYQLGKLLMTRSDAVICVSEAERVLLAGDFPAVAPRAVTIPNGADVAAIRQADPMPAQPPTVLCVGRLEAYKGVADVVTAFQEVPAPAQLVIAGDGPQRAELERLIAELGLAGRVRLLGRVDDSDLHRWFRTARVLVSMSRREAFGMVALEAAAGGARVLLSDIAAHREIARTYLPQASAIVADPSPDALAAQIREALTASEHPAAQDIPDWAQVAARTVEVYRSALARSAPPPAPARVEERIR